MIRKKMKSNAPPLTKSWPFFNMRGILILALAIAILQTHHCGSGIVFPYNFENALPINNVWVV